MACSTPTPRRHERATDFLQIDLQIDAHLHLWQLARGDYGWITDQVGPLQRDFEPEEARQILDAAGVDHAVLVQAAPTEAETRFLLEHARVMPWVAGVVGWADLEAQDAPDRLAALAADRNLVGIRPMIQDIPDPDWMLRPELTSALKAVHDLDLAFDALVRPRHLDNLLTLLERMPDLRVVIDHGAKPDIATGALEPWSTRMRALAASGAYCKLSGLVSEAGADWSTLRLRPFADHLIEVFGPERLIWGSDWPVVTLAADYASWRRTSELLLEDLSVADRARVFGVNAADFYRLKV